MVTVTIESKYHGNCNICVVNVGWERDNIIRFEWERNNAIYLVTVKMGMVIPISHGNLQNYQLPRKIPRYFTVVIIFRNDSNRPGYPVTADYAN